MKLLDKTLVIICITLVGMVLLMYVASQVILMGSYSSMENADVAGKMDSALRAISYDLSMLDTITVDYAYWDDTYEFIAEPYITEDTPYVLSNLVDTTFEMQRLNIVVFLDSTDNIVYARAYDLDNERFVDMPDGFIEVLKQGSPLLRSGSDESTHGVAMLQDKPMLVSAYPIKNSDGNSPTGGTLIMGRFLDEKGIQTLGDITGLSMEVMPYSGTALPEDYRNALPRLEEHGSVVAEPINDTTVAGYTIIDDIFGNPALVLRVDEPRSMYIQGQNSVIYYILSLIFAGIVFITVTVFLLEKTVISRIAQLSNTVHLIGAKDDPSTRVHVSGNDEVSLLAETINTTLASLQSSREKLFASEQKFRSLVENIGDIVLEANDRYELTYISPNVKKVLGYDPEEVIGKLIYDFIGIEDAARLKYMNIQLFATNVPIVLIDIEFVDKEGRLIDIELSGTKTIDPQGRIIGFHGVARDVRERKRIERTMRKWADIFQMARIPITISDPGNVMLDMVNPAFSQMYGYDAEDLYNIRFEDIFDVSCRNDLGKHINRADIEGHHVFGSRHVRKDGSVFPVSIDISVVKDPQGNVLYRIINVQDITERKEAEEVLQAANDELAKVVHALQDEVAERKRVEEQIAGSLKEKEVLLKEIHHRVKNNLQIISSLLNLQSGNMNKESAAAFRESQNRIKSMALIHEKLYQSRDLSHIDFAEYVSNLTSYLARSYTNNPRVNISTDIREISLGIDMAIPCGLIINELVSNSLKYAFGDGRTGEIRINMVMDGGKYILIVSDDGVGLPQEFDFHNSPSLGLQLVNTLVDQLEGTIELEKAAGTTFTIKFGEDGLREKC